VTDTPETFLETTDDGRSRLRVVRRLPHPPAKVWRAIAEPEHLAVWFPYRVSLDLTPGGAMTFTGPGGSDDDTEHGTVLEVDPPRLLAFDWAGSVLRFELEPLGGDGDGDGDGGAHGAGEAGGTAMTFTHTFDDRFGAASFAAGWAECLDALEDDLAGRSPTPSGGAAGMAAEHDRRVVELGLDEPVVSSAPDGSWTVRLERQLTRPADESWRAIVGSGWGSGGGSGGHGAGASGAGVGTGDDSTDPAAGDPVPAGSTVAVDGVVAGPLTRLTPGESLAYPWSSPDGESAGEVQMTLGEGTGQGARLVVTHTGSPAQADRRDAVAAAWRSWAAGLARHLLALPVG
jgi:uncharacterized protein YndB with AHSA1/START domain